MEPHRFGVDLWWIPLGAGGHFVKFNGRVYERLKALRERRRPLELYHSALEVHVPEGRFVIENAWPIPVAGGHERGVVVEGPVFSPSFARLRSLRYEVRRWPDGIIYDVSWAVGGPRRVTDDLAVARNLLGLVPTVPSYVWGRRVPGTDEMWNSNSVVAWLLARGGIPVQDIQLPAGGRAPGWSTGARLGAKPSSSPEPAA